MCNEVRGLSIAMMEELAEEVQLRFPGEKVHMHLLITIYYAARSDHAKRLLAATNDIHNRELVNYLVNLKKMQKSTKTPRCESCNEIMEELLTMRQTFERMSQKLTKQVTELRQEVTEVMGNTTRGKTPNTERNNSPVPTEPPSKVKRFNNDVSETSKVKNINSQKNVPDNSDSEPKEPNRIKQIYRVERPILKLHNLQARVLPTHPFDTAEQFEDWHAVLKEDKEFSEKLKLELIQGCPVEPDKHIKNIWRSIFKHEAADCYSYNSKGRSKRRALKNYLFTQIFQESFLKRFPGLDDSFFIDNTIRFFIYVHNQVRKSLRDKEKLRAIMEPRVQNEAFTDDEMEVQIFNDDEDTIL